MILPEDLAAAFLRETGIELRVRTLFGAAMLTPARGTWGIVIAREQPGFDESTHGRLQTRAYPHDVHLVWWGGAEIDEIDAALRRLDLV